MKRAPQRRRMIVVITLAVAFAAAGCVAGRPDSSDSLPPASPEVPALWSGPLAQPDQTQLPGSERSIGGLTSFGPLEDCWQARPSPAGKRVALVANDRRSLAVYSLSGDEPQGDIVLTWRGPGAVDPYADPWTASGQIGLLGRRDDSTLVFVAGEPDPSGTGTGNGVGVWIVDVGTRKSERLTWLAVQGYRDQPQSRWLTADGKTAVVIHWRADLPGSPLVTLVTAVDLETGAARTVATSVPIYEPGGMSLFQRTADGWAIAWQTPDQRGAPAATDVHVLNLRDGRDRIVYRTGEDGAAAGLVWSPDGTRLAVFAAEPGDKFAVVKNRDDWTDWVAPKCIIVAADGRTAVKVIAPGDGFAPEASWSPDGRRVTLHGTEIVPLPTPNDYGLKCTARVGPMYVADLSGSVTQVASPPPEQAADLTVQAAYSADGSLSVTYAWNTGCRTTLFDAALNRVGEWSELRPVLAELRIISTTGGLVASDRNMLGLYVVSDTGERNELLPGTWRVTQFYARSAGGLVLLPASSTSELDSFAQRLFVLPAQR